MFLFIIGAIAPLKAISIKVVINRALQFIMA
jgi:hypothetical protein